MVHEDITVNNLNNHRPYFEVKTSNYHEIVPDHHTRCRALYIHAWPCYFDEMTRLNLTSSLPDCRDKPVSTFISYPSIVEYVLDYYVRRCPCWREDNHRALVKGIHLCKASTGSFNACNLVFPSRSLLRGVLDTSRGVMHPRKSTYGGLALDQRCQE